MIKLLFPLFIICVLLLTGCSGDYVAAGTGRSEVQSSVLSQSKMPPLSPNRNYGSADSIEAGIFDGINNIRSEHGLSVLKRDSQLDVVARRYSQTMARAGKISHEDAQGKHMEDRLEVNGITDWSQAGENLASSVGTEPVRAALWGWQRSPGHMENILLPSFVLTGIGAYTDPRSGEVYITQLFTTP